jgi:hypothetical protein
MDRVGPFRSDLRSSGDKEWGNRVAAAGLPLVFWEGATVLHPARRTRKEHAKKIRRLTGGFLDIKRIVPRVRWWGLPRRYLGLTIDVARRVPRHRRSAESWRGFLCLIAVDLFGEAVRVNEVWRLSRGKVRAR